MILPRGSRGYIEYWELKPDKWHLFTKFNDEVIQRFRRYQVPVIALTKETPKEAVCLVFEKVNQGGVSLTVFELLTASFAVHDFRLRDDWAAREQRLKSSHPALRSMENTLFLQAVTLLATKHRKGVASCRRRDVLNLTVEDYKAWADVVEKGFETSGEIRQRAKGFHG